MLFEVRHVTKLGYSRPVVLEPITIRLRPRAERCQQLHEFALELDPSPTGRTELTDVDGNDATLAWFFGKTSHLTIATSLRAETTRFNPFDYVIPDPEMMRLPVRYSEGDHEALRRFLSPEPPGLIRDWVRSTVEEADTDATRFATSLCRRIAAELDDEIRLEGEARASVDTLEQGRGSCRDLAVLFIDGCRAMGLAARFVSGYQQGDPDEKEKQLHAWGEVFLPAVGWRGFDPTLGLAVADAHLALAAGPTPESAAPTAGTFRGSARARLTSELDVKTS